MSKPKPVLKTPIGPKAYANLGCEECQKIGAKWVHLRQCTVCGHIGCCNSSEHKHATAHYHESGHATMQSVEPGEDWKWNFSTQEES